MEQELKHLWRFDKILNLEAAAKIATEAKAAGKKVVTMNGSFDILHGGHLDFIEEAKGQGDVLIVGINSDRSIRGAKGPSRPFIGQEERAALLAALCPVDYVVLIDESYDQVPRVLIETVKPNVHVNGSEYGEPSQWIEWPTMQAVGAQGYVVPRRPGLATSDLVAKIKASI